MLDTTVPETTVAFALASTFLYGSTVHDNLTFKIKTLVMMIIIFFTPTLHLFLSRQLLKVYLLIHSVNSWRRRHNYIFILKFSKA